MRNFLTLGELVTQTHGSIKTGPFGTVLKAVEYSTSGGVPIISVGEVGDGFFSLRPNTPRASTALVQQLPSYVLAEGDIVFARKGAVERSARVGREEAGWFLGSDGIRIRLGQSTDSRFLSYQLRTDSTKKWILQRASGTTMASLNGTVLGGVPIWFPDLFEQIAIAEVLAALDAKITSNVALARIVGEYLAACFAKGLKDGGWQPSTLGAVADVNSRTVKPGAGSLRYIDIAAVAVGGYSEPELMRWDNAPSRARRRLGVGDTVWSTVRPNRRQHALILASDPLLVASTGLAVISPREVGFAYLYEATRQPSFTQFLESAADGSAYPAVRADRFLGAPISMMTEAKRDAFEGVAAPLRQHSEQLRTENLTLIALRETLLPHLMSGQLRVEDAERQVEAVV